ncbi:leukocyte elastase inhibitor-like isoform X4 [Periplaneta americana]|uniref:leukocyte elastase inhibitor-like isoform X4 n=1 Tax=Periplaneta americana TaxID=6978 RepID=UPI0037E77FC4
MLHPHDLTPYRSVKPASLISLDSVHADMEFNDPPKDRTKKIVFDTVLFVSCLVFGITLATMSANKAVTKARPGNMEFANELYRAVCSKEGNVFISPVSLEVVMALAYMGARGNTAQQIKQSVHLPEDGEDVKANFKALMGSLKSTENMTLEIANKIFTQEKYKILSEYRAVAEESFLSGAQELNFADSEGSRKIINSWVEEKTRDKIKDLIPPGMLNDLTRLVLVNAIYFKGFWKRQFDAARTRPGPFHLNSKEEKTVPMMHLKAKFGYTESGELDSKILEMPYQGQDISMFVILPNDVDGISKLEEKLAGSNLSEILKHLPVREVEVTMPKFKLEETTDLNEILQKMGMTDMFSESRADFSGISGARDLFVSNVLQKAFIEVNEEGSEAAAATGMMTSYITRGQAPEFPKIFNANHPFVFVLQKKVSAAVLFLGRFAY